jgi:starch synthase
VSKVLYISSEAFPLIKTGGLADVAGSLPVALLKESQDVRLLLPAYSQVLDKISSSKVVAECTYYNLPVQILETKLPGSNVIVWLVDCPVLFNRPGGPYADSNGQAWPDNALRFAVFCHAAVDISLNKLGLNWQPDVSHCNDWQTGLVPALLTLQPERPVTIFTIHNLAYQGVYDKQTFDDLHLPVELWHMHGVEFYDYFSFIKGGLAYADKITTVSPSYAREILQPEFGYGLDGLLQNRVDHLSGILNGIDEKHWSPGSDTHLKHKYNRRSLAKKSLNKIELQKQLSLPVDQNIPMIGMISRLVQQKGLDIILQSLPSLLTMPIQLVILGTGEAHYEQQLIEWANRHTERFKVIIGYDESLSHMIEAASDIYLMPSTFEPCGLNQMYSLRYGTLPIASNVGGLADTVVNASEENIEDGTANGFILKNQTATALLAAVQHALSLYQQPQLWRQLQTNAMSEDFSWVSSADHYISLYQQALADR